MKLSNISKPTLIFVLVVAILSGLFGATAATTIYNSSLVSYNNAASGMQSNNVQDAVDELYAAATTYETLASRISYLETHITSDATSRIRENGIELNDTSGGTTTGGYIDFHWQGSNADYTSRIIENSNGVINISAVNGVKANGQNIVTSNEVDSLDIGGLTLIGTSISCHNCTGTIDKNGLKYKIVGKHLVLLGRIELKNVSRSASNPGLKIVLPESKKIRGSINAAMVGPCTTRDGSRLSEATQITADNNNNYFLLTTTETYTNVQNGSSLVFYVAPSSIPIS